MKAAVPARIGDKLQFEITVYDINVHTQAYLSCRHAIYNDTYMKCSFPYLSPTMIPIH